MRPQSYQIEIKIEWNVKHNRCLIRLFSRICANEQMNDGFFKFDRKPQTGGTWTQLMWNQRVFQILFIVSKSETQSCLAKNMILFLSAIKAIC